MAHRVPSELRCMEPEDYKKYFRNLCWSGTRKERRLHKRAGKKEKLRRLKAANPHAVCYAPALLGNPSQFAVYASVRRTILTRWKFMNGSHSELSDDSDSEDSSQVPANKLPKITGIGLRTVFSLISQARFTDSSFCENSLKALLDVLQGHSPEELAHEPTEIITTLHAMLVEVASGSGPSGRIEVPTVLTALSSSCLIALSVARGEAELILHAVATLIMSPSTLSDQYLQIPSNLTTLQRSVQHVLLGSPSRNQWLHFGVPHQCLVNTFSIDPPLDWTSGSVDLIVRSLVSDGCFLYIYTSKGLLKIGSGYGSSIRQHVYLYKPDFFATDRHGWLGYCKDKLYLRIGRKKTEVYEIDKDSLEVKNTIRLDPGQHSPVEQKSAVFTDGNQLGLILLNSYDNLTIRMYDVDTLPERTEGSAITILTSRKELNVHLLRRRTLVLGRSPFEDGMSRRTIELDAPVAMQLDDCDEDPLLSIYGGQEFALLTTASGKVYYTGKGYTLGYKAASPQTGRWTLMKETIFSRNEAPNVKRCKVVHVAVGHEGVHAILVLDNGTALFTGMARRGEDGDAIKSRRTPKPTRPKKIYKAEGHHIIYAACNYGSTALITRQGLLLMFGKDTQHCDAAGIVQGLRHERVVQVALGKAHAVALTNIGHVYTFGINNKGQCGREFGYTKEKLYPPRRRNVNKEEPRVCAVAHTWTTVKCRICVMCRECTGFASSCRYATLPNRIPGDECGCGQGDSGCNVCGICRRCADVFAGPLGASASATVTDLDDDIELNSEQPSATSDTRAGTDFQDKENGRYAVYEGHATSSEGERDASVKVTSMPPAKVAIPGAHRIVAVACGLHHTVLLTEQGEVLTFGSNQSGQLGAGDLSVHHRLVRVRVPRASSVTAGSNHTAVLTKDGELYTFGSYEKGSLGRPRQEEPTRTDRGPIWYATPGRVPRLGPRHSCKAVWVSASGDQTFLQVSQALIKTDTLFSSTITANNNNIIILPNRAEHSFKCITINKADGSCNTWTGAEQVDFVNTLACLDPLYDVLWCYQPQIRTMKCYNILTFDSHKLQRCCNNPTSFFADGEYEYPNYGSMKRLEDFKNLENFDLSCSNENRPVNNVALTNTSVLNQELAIPSSPGCSVTRMHAALHLLGCLDSLNYAHDVRLSQVRGKRENTALPIAPLKEDFMTVNRFESHGGGWGYSGHSVEAIRFMCDTDVMIGGFGLFGGRGDYTARIKLFDIGAEGGDQEGDGELVAESDEIVYECPPRDRFPVLFEMPVQLVANRWYVAWACINGPSSDCGSSGQAMVINDEIGFHFKTSKKSNNGTDVNAGQIPCLLYNTVSPDQGVPLRSIDTGEPITILSKNISRNVTVQCFRYLITLLQWSWSTFKDTGLETNGLIPINFQKLAVIKNQRRLLYVITASLRLVKSYINEIYPQNNRKRNSHEFMSYCEAIADVRNLIQAMMADPTPSCSMLPRKPGKNKAHRVCYVQLALDMTTTILNEAHDTLTACFHAFFPTPTLKWNHLCSLLFNVKEGVVPSVQIRELTATSAAMCASRSLRDVLQYVVPITQTAINTNNSTENKRPDSKVIVKDVPSKSATVPRSSQAQKPPPVPPRANNREAAKQPEPVEARTHHTEWHLLDVVLRLLDIVMIPMKQQMMTRQCGQLHDHGEIKQHEKLSESCCKLVARIVAELAYSATNIREDVDSNTTKHLVTPSRFMRINQSRAWNTGNGSPDAICFSVDRPGIMLVGVCVYGGLGNYEYSLELLHDVRQLRAPADDANPAHCWVSLEMAHGSFCAADCQNDIVQLKFDRPVPLKEDLRYALRLCNQGGRTANGDCGLPSVKGSDGTSFRFASCSLSFNGTTLVRGQLPSLIYYGTSKTLSNTSESAGSLITVLRGMTLRVASMVMDRSADLFCKLRNELTAEDLRRNAAVLQQSPAINTLIPYTLANLEGLDDAKSVIKILDMIHKLLPHVAAMNLLVPNFEEAVSTSPQYYTWVESEHPYKQATVINKRVLFPSNVSWMVLEMDSRSITAQPEDSLTVYAVAGKPKHRCHCASEVRVSDPPFRKRLVQLTSEGEVEDLGEDGDGDGVCMHYNCSYVSVTPRLANNGNEWPQKALLVPGNECIFSLETASDYLNEYNKANNEDNRFGFRCLCVGYEDTPLTNQRQGLVVLEMELVYTGSACASRLLSPDLDIPPMSYVEMQAEAQMKAPMGAAALDKSEATVLSKGLELSSPPTVHQVLDGQPLQRCVSTERQFLTDFVAGAESTAGGRLARWLAPTSRVEPSKCEIKSPAPPIRPSTRISLPILIRDQYGENVSSPALKVDVVVQRVESSGPRPTGPLNGEASLINIPDEPYQPSVRDNMCYHAITMMKGFHIYSFEELRLASESWADGGAVGGAFAGVPAERLTVSFQPDGSWVATWTPRFAGTYQLRCTLDDLPVSQEIMVDVTESVSDRPSEQAIHVGPGCPRPSTPPCRLRRFAARFSAGLRVRASPSLQAEEIGRVTHGTNIAFVEELVNKDGTWVRLSNNSALELTDGAAEVAWCIQHHRHFDRAMLLPVEPSTPPLQELQMQFANLWTGFGKQQPEAQSQKDDESAASESEDTPFTYVSGAEPSKRFRLLRDEPMSTTPSPRRMQRRSNGNSNEWWTPPKLRCSDDDVKDVNAIQETDIEPEPTNSQEYHSTSVAQTGTQTSPEPRDELTLQIFTGNNIKSEISRLSPKSIVRERIATRSRAYKRASSSPPPLPARAAPAPPLPKKHALSPTQSESLRAVFAALLWHEGIVHDAIACSAFLKFHPQLPKQGERVVTRPTHDVTAARQRHSVEVSNAGAYLQIHQSTLESLTRSGMEASTSRVGQSDIDMAIREEEPQPGCSRDTGSAPSVVNVLPPALRALVALWDALYEAEKLNPATDKGKREPETNENDDTYAGIKKKRDSNITKASNTPYSVRCELCGGASVSPPLGAHMRHAHVGCRAPTRHGYDRAGAYRRADPPPPHQEVPLAHCGQLSQSYQLWYMFCEKCRDKTTKASSAIRQTRVKIQEIGQYERTDKTVDHHIMKDNATFLLDLAPLTNTETHSSSLWNESTSRSPPTPPGSMWQPAPPFQCLPALGAAPTDIAPSDTARYHSLGRPPPPAIAPVAPGIIDGPSCSQWPPRVQRSVSMGQTTSSDLASAARPPPARDAPIDQDTLTGAGSSLLAQPSASLSQLIGCRNPAVDSVSAFEAPRVDVDAIMKSPIMTFLLSKRDLHGFREKMDATVRLNTVRQYAFEALNWLLRSTTQPTSVHDVMWWFCNALDKFARIIPPTLAIDDNKENASNENNRIIIPTAAASTICPGGSNVNGSRAAFHAFLGSVSVLAPSLPHASAAGLQAVRCWMLHYSLQDRAFLHRSQVFNVISKILSHSEDGAHEEGMLGAVHESFHSYLNKENFVWSCPDVTGWCDVSVSSRQGMAGALTDGSTETFWESGDEDRNKAKWIQVVYPGGSPDDRPHILCVHLDNTRDTANKTLLVSFLYSGGSSEMFHMQDVEVDPKTATWLCYTMPRATSASVRVRCELRGPEPAVRVRQVRVLGAPTPRAAFATTPAQVLHARTETDTLRVFRLLTSQIFGKLLEYMEFETGGEGPRDETSDLREHVVGILFSGHKLTNLQKMVMKHIVEAINDEVSRIKTDWDTALLIATIHEDEESDEEPPKASLYLQDNYCFEMLSLLLALSGSSVGRAHLAQRSELICDLLTLLHIGSERVQRQIIFLLRRMLLELSPQRMLVVVNEDSSDRELPTPTLIDHLMGYLSKALTVQVKVKGANIASPNALAMADVSTLPRFWFMRGVITKHHGHLVAKLLTDMTEDKFSPEWGIEMRQALTYYILHVAQISDEQRLPQNCLKVSVIWLALTALCICQQAHVDLINAYANGRESRREGDSRAFCSNHDDGSTLAVIECRTCGPLCAECDRFLHLNRAARTHHRQICKEEESAIRVDIHEGCGRAKLFWLLLLVDQRTLKGLIEFRGMDGVCKGGDPMAAAVGPPGLAGTCRFCGTRGTSGLLAIGNVCADEQCQEHGKEACNRVLPCSHLCGGVRGERTCLPCLYGCAVADETRPLRQDADDMCMICFTDPLQAAPAIQLRCGHVFHLHCCKKVLANKWIGPRITFSFSQCPICKEDMDHWTLEELLTPIRHLYDEVKRKALIRLEYEGLAAPGAANGRQESDPEVYAMERYAYYVCHKCSKAYFGGLARCEAETSELWEPSELVCGACSDVAGACTCPKHGADFLEYKCRYCCSVAVFFCFGTSHFCNSCHDDFQRVTNIPKHSLPQCPAGPKGEQLPGTSDECPLHVQHPPTGEEFALGCGVCRHAQAF